MKSFFDAMPWPGIVKTMRRSRFRQRIIDSLTAIYSHPDWNVERIAAEAAQLPRGDDWLDMIRAAAAQAGKPID